MSFPKVGDSSAAFAINLTTQGVAFGIDLIMFRVGEILGDVVYEDLGSPDPSTVEGFVKNYLHPSSDTINWLNGPGRLPEG